MSSELEILKLSAEILSMSISTMMASLSSGATTGVVEGPARRLFCRVALILNPSPGPGEYMSLWSITDEVLIAWSSAFLLSMMLCMWNIPVIPWTYILKSDSF